MEEKERYKWSQDIIVECPYEDYDYIVDTENNIIFDDENYFKLVDILNQQDKRIKELEEENKECKHWENMFHKLSTEEDNAITKVNKSLSNPMALIDDYDKWADYTLEQIKQSQKQFAIEKLEKIKNYFDDSNDDKHNESEGWIITNRNVVEYVSKQIKELKDEVDMEENERFTVFGEHCIKDNSPDARCQLLNAYEACIMLNEQDKENHQLKQQFADKEQENERLKEEICKYEITLMDKNSQLKQQLAEKDRKNLLLYSMLYTTLEKQDTENVSSRIAQMTGETLDKQSEWFKTNRVCDKLQHYIKQVIKEKEELKQQLHDLPKKIVKEIKGKQPNFTENSYGFTTKQGWDICVEILDTILKKFGGGNE